MSDLDARQQAAAERWLKGRTNPNPTKRQTPSNERTREHDHAPDLEKERRSERDLGAPEDDLLP
jgi:hypothetical protein